MPAVTATAACSGLRPVANALGVARGQQVQPRLGHARARRQPLHHLVQPRRLGDSSGLAPCMARAMRSLNQYEPKFITTTKKPANDQPRGPPRRWPTNSRSAVSPASSTVVFSALPSRWPQPLPRTPPWGIDDPYIPPALMTLPCLSFPLSGNGLNLSRRQGASNALAPGRRTLQVEAVHHARGPLEDGAPAHPAVDRAPCRPGARLPVRPASRCTPAPCPARTRARAPAAGAGWACGASRSGPPRPRAAGRSPARPAGPRGSAPAPTRRGTPPPAGPRPPPPPRWPAPGGRGRSLRCAGKRRPWARE